MSLRALSVQNKIAGFTLIELVLTIVILGFSVTMLIPFFSAITHSPDPVLREKAVALGQAMMDEITGKKWDKNTPVGGGPVVTGETPANDGTTCAIAPAPCIGNRLNCFVCRNPGYIPGAASAIGLDGATAGANNRKLWDDVDDYDGLNEPLSGTFYDQDGASLPGIWTGFTRIVKVSYIASNTGTIDQNTAPAATTTDTKLVVVTVTSPLGETFYFVSVVCNI
jgi:MSHA pilin protein MshD